MGSRGERRGGLASQPEVDGVWAARGREESERSILEAPSVPRPPLAAPGGGLAAAAFSAPDSPRLGSAPSESVLGSRRFGR